MSLTILEEIIRSTRMSDEELAQEIAVMLYQKEKLTLGQASRLSKMSQIQFQHILASRKISLHYDEKELEEDISTLKELGRL